MLNRTILIDDGAKEIVVYRAMREGIGVTVSNAPSIFCDVTNRGDYVSEIKKILSLADFKWLYIDFERGKEKLTSMFTGFGANIWALVIFSELDEYFCVHHWFLLNRKLISKIQWITCSSLFLL